MNDQQFDPNMPAKNDPSTIQPLSEDNETPFSPPDNLGTEELESSHQTTDNASNLDPHEIYDEGLSGAAEAEEPNKANVVKGYHPKKEI